ncbi:MAG: hypothetical protein U5R06_05680 [candidate division KSB1 bacterium]|nr:hypothetical protein [candidate division KSB1 bacterium]
MNYRILILILFFKSILFAAEFSVPIGSEKNTFSLRINNDLYRSMTDVAVKVVHSPEWVIFEDSSIFIEKIDPQNSKVAEFYFDVANDMTGQTGSIVMDVVDQFGHRFHRYKFN